MYNGSIFGAHYTKRVLEASEKYFPPRKFEIFSAHHLAEMSKLQGPALAGRSEPDWQ